MATYNSIDSVVNSLTGEGTLLNPLIIDKFRRVAHQFNDALIITSLYGATTKYGAHVVEPALDEVLADGLPAVIPIEEREKFVRAFDAIGTEKWVSLVKSYKASVQPNAFSGFVSTLYDHEDKANSVYEIMSNPNAVNNVNSLDDESLSSDDGLSLDVFSTLLFSAQETTDAELIILTAQAASKYKGQTAKEVAYEISYIANPSGENNIELAKAIASIFKTDEVSAAIHTLGLSAPNVARQLINLNHSYDGTKHLSKAAIALSKYEPEVAEYFANELTYAALHASVGNEEWFARTVSGISSQESVDAVARYNGRPQQLFVAKEVLNGFRIGENLDSGKNLAQIIGSDDFDGLLTNYEGKEEHIFNAIRPMSILSPDLMPVFTEFLNRDYIHQALSSLQPEIEEYLVSAIARKINIEGKSDNALELIRLLSLAGVKSVMERYRGERELAAKVAFELINVALRYGSESMVVRRALPLQNRMWAQLLDTPNLDSLWK